MGQRNVKTSEMSEEDLAVFKDFQFFGGKAKKWMQKCILLLLRVEERRIWEKKGFLSIYEFAAKLSGMSRNKVNEGLRILRKIEELPEMKKVMEKRGIWAVKPVLRVVNMENQKFWAEKAMTMNQKTLATYVRDFERTTEKEAQSKSGENIKMEAYFGRGAAVNRTDLAADKPICLQEMFTESAQIAGPKSSSKKITAHIKLDPAVFAELENLKGTQDWNALMLELLEARRELVQRKQEELEAVKPEKVQTSSPYIPMKIQRYVRARARGKCESPGCTRVGEHFHHTYRFALRKEHDPDKIRLLCEGHHSIAHYGLIENEELEPQNWKVRKFADLSDFKSVIDGRVAEHRRFG